jgi:hypothetical protein
MNTQISGLTISKNSVVRTTLGTRHRQWNPIEGFEVKRTGGVDGATPAALHSWPHLLGRQRSSTTTAIRLDLPDILLLPVTQHNLCSCAGFAGLAGSGWRLLIKI